MRKYYFVCSIFPKLSLDNKPEMEFGELRKILENNLNEKDKHFLKILQMYRDIQNLKYFWKKKTLMPYGNLDEKGFDEALLTESFFPQIVFDYINKTEDKIGRFSYLLYSFFSFYKDHENLFLSHFYTLERDIHIISCFLRAKEENKDISRELHFEDAKDPFLQMFLLQRGEVDVPFPYEKLKEIFNKNKEDPKNLHRKFLEWRFFLNQKKITNTYFTIDEILAYIANLFIVEDFYRLDKNYAKTLLNNYIG